jgi:hypothetical protein
MGCVGQLCFVVTNRMISTGPGGETSSLRVKLALSSTFEVAWNKARRSQ